jgi:hypothetical protein
MPILRDRREEVGTASPAALVRPAALGQGAGARRTLPFTSLPDTARRVSIARRRKSAQNSPLAYLVTVTAASSTRKLVWSE